MADQSVSDVLAVRGYKGDSTAGGSQTFGIKLDATPFDKLALYTYSQNKEMWERQNTQDDLAAKEMAKMMALDVNSSFPEFYEQLNKQKQDISDMLKDPTVLDYQKNPEGYKKLQSAYADLSNNKNKAVANDVKYNAELARIEALPIEQQAAQRAILDNNKKMLLGDGADKALKEKPLLAIGGEFKPKDFELPTAGDIKYTTTKILGNNNKEIGVTVPDGNGVWVQSGKLALGLDQTEFEPIPNLNNDKNVELQNQNAKIKFKQNKKLGNNIYQKQTLDKFNELIPTYEKALAQYNALPPEQRGTPPPKPAIVEDVERMNNNIDVVNKLFADQKSRGVSVPEPYRKINTSDGIDAQEYIYLQSLSKVKEFIKYDEKLTHTGDLTSENNSKRNEAGAMARARLPYDEQKKSIQALGTSHFGNLIYGVNLPKVEVPNFDGKASIKDGSVIDKNGRVLTQVNGDAELPRDAFNNSILLEYNKYAGVKTTTKDGVITTENNPGAELPTEGRLRAKYEKGTIVGIYSKDNTLVDVDLMQQITIKAGQMGVNKYKDPNTEYGVGGDPTKQTTQGTTTTESSKKSGSSAAQYGGIDANGNVIWK